MNRFRLIEVFLVALVGGTFTYALEQGPEVITPTTIAAAPQLGGSVYAPQMLIRPRTCTLTIPAVDLPMPPGYEGARVQITRNGQNHDRSDSSAPYGPFEATIDRGEWVIRAKITKRDMPTFEAPLGTVRCG